MAANYHEEKLGMLLEQDLTASLKDHFADDPDAVVYAGGTEADIEQGTDLFIYGVPVDITFNFTGKDHLEAFAEKVDVFGGVDVSFGVRTGNSHKGFSRFKKPVLVIGIDASESFIRDWMPRIISSFIEKIDEIIDVSQSQYWDWCDANAIAF